MDRPGRPKWSRRDRSALYFRTVVRQALQGSDVVRVAKLTPYAVEHLAVLAGIAIADDLGSMDREDRVSKEVPDRDIRQHTHL